MINRYFACISILVCCFSQMRADIVVNESDRHQFNRVLLRHVQAIGYALAHPDLYLHVRADKGLAAWWCKLLIDGGLDALLQDQELCKLTRAFHEMTKKDAAYQQALKHLRALESAGASAKELRQAQYQADVLYVVAEMNQVTAQGCKLKRPAGYPSVNQVKPGSAGTLVITDTSDWGDIAYIAGIMDANADIEYEKYDQSFRILMLAQLIAWHDKNA